MPFSAASAVDFFPGDPQFQVTGDIVNGSVSATIGNSGISSGAFQDRFFFTIDQTGMGSGSLSTSTSLFGSVTDLDIASVSINGIFATKISDPDGLVEFFSLVNVPINSGVLNSIIVTGTSRGNGSYGGNATFLPTAVPELATWTMMIIGFGLTGVALRRRQTVTVRFA